MVRIGLVIAIVSLIPASNSAAEQLFAMSVSGHRLGTCDLNTGQFTAIGSVETPIQNIAYRSADGYLYGYDYEHHRRLVRIDPVDASTTPLGLPSSDYGWWGMQALTYDSNRDLMYASPSASNALLEVDPQTGTMSLIGTMDENTWAMAFDSGTDTLYAVTLSEHSLVKIDISDGSQTVVGEAGNLGSVEGLTFNPLDGMLYAVQIGSPWQENSVLARIDPQTGVATTIGNIGSGDFISGLAFVPEPTTSMLLLLGGVVVATRRRSRTSSR